MNMQGKPKGAAVTDLNLYQTHSGVVDLADPIACFTRGALEAVDFLYRQHGVPARIEMSRDQRRITVTYPAKPGHEHPYVYVLRPVAEPNGARQYWEIRTRSGRIDHGTGTLDQVQAFFAGIHAAGEYLRIPVERLTLFAVSEPANRLRATAPTRMDDLAQGATRARAKAGIRPKGA